VLSKEAQSESFSYVKFCSELLLIPEREPDNLSYTERHDGVDYIVSILFESFDGFLATDVGL
jgi:hypothetical protein